MMKSLIKISVFFALVLMTFQPAIPAQALSMSTFKGGGAVAFFVSVEGCIQTNVDIYTAEGMVKEAPGAPQPFSSVNIYISQYDTCSATEVLYVDAIADLAELDLQIDPKLQEASLNTTLTVTDTLTGNTFDIAIDIAWTGIGPLTHDHYNFRLGDRDCRIHDRNNFAERAIIATGSVRSETQNFTPEPSAGGWLISNNSNYSYFGCD
jgi:hypothetical protein